MVVVALSAEGTTRRPPNARNGRRTAPPGGRLRLTRRPDEGMHVDGIRYEVGGATGVAAVIIDLTQVEKVDAALDALGTDEPDGATLHLVVRSGGASLVAPRRGGVRFHDSVAAALSAARARHSPVSAV